MNCYNPLLFIKTITRPTKITIVLLVIILLFSINYQYVAPMQVQLISLLILSIALLLLNISNYPGVKLRLYEYKLKLVSEKGIKLLILLKVSFYFLIGYKIVQNINYFNDLNFAIFTFLWISMCAKTMYLNNRNLKRQLFILAMSSLTLVNISIYLLWIIYSCIFIFTTILEPDYYAMELMTIAVQNAFEKKHFQENRPPQKQLNKKQKIKSLNSYVWINSIDLLKVAFIIMISSSILVYLMWVAGYASILNKVVIVIIYLLLQYIFEKKLKNILLIRNTKLYPVEIMNELIYKQAITIGSMLLVVTIFFSLILSNIILLYTITMLVISVLAIRVLLFNRKKLSSVLEALIITIVLLIF